MSGLLLSLLIFFPLLAGVIVLALPEARASLAKGLAVGSAALTLLLSLATWAKMQPNGGLQLVQKLPWIPFAGVEYHVGVDGISLFLLVLSALFALLAMLYSWQQELPKAGRFFGLILLFTGGVHGTLLSLNLIQFYFFWELMLVPMFFLVGIWGGPNRIKAVTRFVIYTMAGSLALLLSIIYLGVQQQAHDKLSFDLTVLSQLQLPATPLVDLLFFGFALAFLIKMPLFPLHTWLPDTYTEAPPAVTFLLSGVMAKMGVYGLIRIPGMIFPDAMARWSPVLSALAIVGIIYAAILALGQDEIKRLIAYSSISHLGLIALGVFSWNASSLEGVVYHMINHAVATGALFLLAGLLEARGLTRISQLGGVAARAPGFAALFVLMGFASIGVPGLNGFVGEFLILIGVASRSALFALLAALTLILSASYTLWLVQRAMFGPAKGLETDLSLTRLQLAAVVPLSVLAVVMGLYTLPFTQQINPTIEQTISSQQKPQQALSLPEADRG